MFENEKNLFQKTKFWILPTISSSTKRFSTNSPWFNVSNEEYDSPPFNLFNQE
jgi:hypothetical protein